MSDGFASLRRRTQTFIAYLYKPEAQAKVLQMPIYHSHIIPSLALQAYEAKKYLSESEVTSVAHASGSERKCG
ncbi:MAG: hypothetical protein WCN64_07205 [Planctomycetota bacterium]